MSKELIDVSQDSDMGDEWETYVQKTAKAFVYPPTPNLSRSLIPDKPVRTIRWRAAWVALVALIIFGALMAVPEVRASVLKVLRIGGVSIVLNDDPTAVPVTPTPPDLSIPNAPQWTLAGETTLEAAQDQLFFPIRIPADLGSPDRVFVQDVGGPLVVLVWVTPDDSSKIQISLHILGPGVYALKGEPEIIRMTRVNGRQALWTEGTHLLAYEHTSSGRTDVDVRYLVEGHVLIWEENRLTYRLESDLSMEEAIQIAESLQGGQ